MHELPALDYAFDALEPHIDARTMEIHHGKHHAGLHQQAEQAALESHDGPSRPVSASRTLLRGIDQLPEAIKDGGPESTVAGTCQPQPSSGRPWGMTPGGCVRAVWRLG